ncbi:MAG: glycosyltransferase [Lentisphaerae bacterium]|nr:glycosyltransferase [Lentisphaerota bacterium]
MPTVTVIIPTYNSAATIAEALISVKRQTFRDYEIIVADDCSTDNTMSVLESVEITHRTIARNKNGGPAAARNDAVRAADGEWLAFLDADDVWFPNRLKMQMELTVMYPDAAGFCGTVIGFDESVPLNQDFFERANASSEGIISAPAVKILSLDEFVYRNPVATSTVIVRKDACESVGGFDESFCGPEDYELWMRLAAKYSIISIDMPLAGYRERVGSLSMDDRKFLPQVLRVIEKAFGDEGVFGNRKYLRDTAISNQLWNASWMAFSRGTRTTALVLLIRSYLLNLHAVQRTERKWRRQLCRYLFGRTRGISKIET